MDIPGQLLLLSLPALIYAAMRARRGGSWRQAFAELGFTAGKPKHYLSCCSLSPRASGRSCRLGGWQAGSSATCVTARGASSQAGRTPEMIKEARAFFRKGLELG